MSRMMDVLVAAADRALGVLGAAPLRARRRQGLSESWSRLAERAGLEVVEVRSDAVVAKLGDLRAVCEGSIRSLSLGFNGSITFSWVGVPYVRVAAHPSSRPMLAVTDDASFDELFDSSGDRAVVRAILDRDTRAALRSLVAVLRSRTMTLDADHTRCLAASGQGVWGRIAGRLAENTTREPLASVRAGNMRQLAETFPDEAVTRELARTLIRDNDPWVRLEAGKALAEEGGPTLIALTHDEAATEDCALQAVHALGDLPSRVEIRAGLEREMGLGRWQVAAAWKKRLGAVLDAGDVRALAAALARWRQRFLPHDIRVLDTEAEALAKEIEYHEVRASSGWEGEYAQGHRDQAVELKSRRHQLLADAGVPIAGVIARALRRAPAREDRDTALLAALSDPWDVRLAATAGLLRVAKHLQHLRDRPALAAAVGTLERAELPEAKESLLALLAHPDADVAHAAAMRLAGAPMQDPEAERALLACLDHPFAAVVRAALLSLGRVGTVRAIPALRACAEKHSGDPDITGMVSLAIAEIQSRLEGASPGQLSLAGGEAGQVSLVEEDQRGQVSLEKPGA